MCTSPGLLRLHRGGEGPPSPPTSTPHAPWVSQPLNHATQSHHPSAPPAQSAPKPHKMREIEASFARMSSPPPFHINRYRATNPDSDTRQVCPSPPILSPPFAQKLKSNRQRPLRPPVGPPPPPLPLSPHSVDSS